MSTYSASILGITTPSTTAPDAQVTLSTPSSSFLSHRRGLQSSDSTCDKDFIENLQGVHTHGHHRQGMSTSSLADPVVNLSRRLSFSNEAIGDGQRSPIYQISQRLGGDSLPILPETASANKDPISKHRAKALPISHQDTSLMSPSSQTKFAITAAGKGLTISPSLACNPSSGFGPIRLTSATLPGYCSRWNSPLNSPKTAGSGSMTIGNAALVAKKRGLAIAIVKDNGGIVPVTPSLESAGLRSQGIGLKSAEVKMIGVAKKDGENGHATATPGLATGRLDSAKRSGSRKEIILCKFYHTPGLTCTSRPCRFLHALSSLTSPLFTDDISQYAMLSPTRPTDPTSAIELIWTALRWVREWY
uniref:Unplaced genomic scaffold supercont1.29, whole genome shotgun sequence n=1 Tax=Cryptococcus bacillisporus CA1280 TaxID=1296109 RepID=A0A0D0VHS2_CRYGA|nr:hypothetical protein I312_06388 [Cryptococcus bacillisporus CA1280]